jgi:acyl-CoA thioesterase-1
LLAVFLSRTLAPLHVMWPIPQRALALSLLMPLFLVCYHALADGDARLRLMVLGDSLVAGHGLPQGESFPDILQAELASAGYDVEVLNAGVSGDTTAGGLARLDWSLAENPDALIIVLGGNDLLRGLEPAATKANLAAIIDHAMRRKITVMLAGMQAPRNFGEDYAGEFDAIYTQLGARDGVIFYPFFLDGVALVPEFNQPDGMHPNRAGVDEIARRIWPSVEALLAAVPSD